MDESLTPRNKIHVGRNIRRIREMKFLSQGDLARALSVRQQKVSKIEMSEAVDENLLSEIAAVFEVTSDYIKSFSPDEIINSYPQSQPSNLNFDSIEKIIELYERLLSNEKDKNRILMMLNRMHEEK